MTTKNTTLTGAFCFLLAAGMAAEARELASPPTPVAQSPYPVVDSGVWADWRGLPNFYWLDNNRVIFTGTEAKGKANAVLKKQIQILDIKTNTVAPYSSNTTGIICYNDGTILYGVGKDSEGNDLLKYGKLNKETTITKPKKGKMYIDQVNCRIHDNYENAPGRKERREIKLLHEYHGYLDYGPITENRNLPLGKGKPILYYRKGKNEPIVLPITNEGTKLRQYYEFKNAYFIHELVGGGGRWYGDSVIAWWLFPDGKVMEVKIPDGPYKQGGSVGLYPTRKGVFVRYDTFKSSKDPGDAGGYFLAEDNTVHKLITGYLNGEVVSPNGCKIAFSYHAYSDATLAADPAPITLKTINVCPEEK